MRLGGFEDAAAGGDRPRRRASGATATSSSTRSETGAGRGPALGFHARGRWDEIVDVDDCQLASEANNAARNAVRDWAAARARAYDGAGAGSCATSIVREGRRTGQIQTRLVTSEAEIPEPPVDLHTVVAATSGGTEGPTGVLGEEYLRERLGGLELRVSPFAFLQTNTETAERLYAIAREFAGLGSGERLFDLYCGIGTIGLSMAADAGEVWGIETVAEAIVDAEANAELNGIANARFRAARRPARHPAADRGGRQARRRRHRPAARRALGEDRPPGARVRGASGSSTSPATRRRWRRTRGRWSMPDIG